MMSGMHAIDSKDLNVQTTSIMMIGIHQRFGWYSSYKISKCTNLIENDYFSYSNSFGCGHEQAVDTMGWENR